MARVSQRRRQEMAADDLLTLPDAGLATRYGRNTLDAWRRDGAVVGNARVKLKAIWKAGVWWTKLAWIAEIQERQEKAAGVNPGTKAAKLLRAAAG
jgi:hypothetical protein